jgi:superfamily II DNA or RNA helicase
MAGHYRTDADFVLFASSSTPAWRAPQRGALGALMSYWSLPQQRSAVISVPTGSGKTAIATAAPYLVGAARVLVVVPSRELRAQLVADFRTEGVLAAIGARRADSLPTVVPVASRVDDWEIYRSADVVVGLPQSVSPAHYESPPPADLFDLVIVDEAHHAPAATWRAILEHFTTARSVLLTATPQRRDGQRIPGDIVYHYPLRQAIAEGFYKPVQPLVVDLPTGATQQDADRRVAEAVVGMVSAPEHATSALLIRAATTERAHALAALYADFGVDVAVLTSRGMTTAQRTAIVDKLRIGEINAVAVVGMLGEGFDLPRLRIAAYHDKHKSTVATVQLIGRLARVEDTYPQDSVIVTPRDVDVFPELQGVVRQLWAEDADWTRVLPGLIDDDVQEARADREYAAHLEAPPTELSVEAIQPSVMAVLYEVPEKGWSPLFTAGKIPEELTPGQILRGRTVYYSAVTPGHSSLLVVTAATARPRWHPVPGLDNAEFEIHIVTWRPAAKTEQAGILAVNSRDRNVIKTLLEILEVPDNLRTANPQRLQDAFDSLQRRSVSNVGVRTTYLGSEGVASYKMFAGRGVDRGLRDADTGRGALGHAMAQIDGPSGPYTAGIATGKGKLWESRYVKLRVYEQYISDYIDRYWFPPAQPLGRLLPTVSRGARIDQFPVGPLIAAIELDHALYIQGWFLDDVQLADLHLRDDPDVPHTGDQLALAAYSPAVEDTPIWRGWQDRNGIFHDTETATVRRGFGPETPLSDVLTQRPPSIYYSDGQTIIGTIIYSPPTTRRELPPIPEVDIDWSGVEIGAETRKSLQNANNSSVGEALERWLRLRPRRFRHRWILLNDGPGEIADYLVIEVDTNPVRVRLELWHAKAAGGGSPSVRVTDLQEVLAQAIKSRRWATDRGLWQELGARLVGERFPRLIILEGSEVLLQVLCGRFPEHALFSFARYTPTVRCTIGIVQPGLSLSQLKQQLEVDPIPLSAQQICELLTVWHDAVSATCALIIAGTP